MTPTENYITESGRGLRAKIDRELNDPSSSVDFESQRPLTSRRVAGVVIEDPNILGNLKKEVDRHLDMDVRQLLSKNQSKLPALIKSNQASLLEGGDDLYKAAIQNLAFLMNHRDVVFNLIDKLGFDMNCSQAEFRESMKLRADEVRPYFVNSI